MFLLRAYFQHFTMAVVALDLQNVHKKVAIPLVRHKPGKEITVRPTSEGLSYHELNKNIFITKII